MRRTIKPFMLGLLLFLLGCGQTDQGTGEEKKLTISAASSMMESLTETKKQFEELNPTIEISYNFGGTGTLRRQIEQGASIDLFFLASNKDFELLNRKGLVKKGEPLFKNRLVVIKQTGDSYDSLEDILHTGDKVAIGTPEAVPAGTYSKQAMVNMGIWEKLQDRIVFTKDVHHVLTLVNEGAVGIGFVYYSDTIKEKNVEVVEEISPHLHKPIQYYVAEIGDGTKKAEIDAFYDFVLGQHGQRIFESHGFLTNEEKEELVE